jgi:hypothetical protein
MYLIWNITAQIWLTRHVGALTPKQVRHHQLLTLFCSFPRKVTALSPSKFVQGEGYPDTLKQSFQALMTGRHALVLEEEPDRKTSKHPWQILPTDLQIPQARREGWYLTSAPCLSTSRGLVIFLSLDP